MINVDNIIKKPYQIESLVEKEILDISKCADPATGPLYFISNFFYIQHPTKGKLLCPPFDYQKDMIKAYTKYRNVVVMSSRQMGKCLAGDINITVRNTKTNKIYDIPIGIYYAWNENKSIDISSYERRA